MCLYLWKNKKMDIKYHTAIKTMDIYFEKRTDNTMTKRKKKWNK